MQIYKIYILTAQYNSPFNPVYMYILSSLKVCFITILALECLKLKFLSRSFKFTIHR